MLYQIFAAGWSIGKFLKSFQKDIGTYGWALTSIIGVIMVIVGVYMLAKNLVSGGKGQTNWVTTFALILVGGALALSTGWKLVGKFAKSSEDQLKQWASGTTDTGANSLQNPFSHG